MNIENRKKIEKGTKTSKFGVSKRENHDSSLFYSSRLYEHLPKENMENKDYSENPIKENLLNKFICTDSRDLSFLPDSSIHLVITSPPYNVSKEYDENLTLKEYRNLIKTVFAEVFPKLVNGGRICINIANIGRKPYIPLHSYIIQDLIDLGYSMRGEIIWNKSASAGTSTAWGSWQSASNPVLRDIHEYILIFSKDSYSRKKENKENTITKEEFLENTKSIWNFPTESAKRVGHPAPFPVELPYRLIQMYSFKEDVVLDPLCGSGTTCIAAFKSYRNFIGIDINDEYIELAKARWRDTKAQRKISDFI